MMIRSLYHIFYMVWIFVASVSAGNNDKPLIRNLTIYGNHTFSNEMLSRAGGISENNYLPDDWPDDVLKRILSHYYQNGYYFSVIDSFYCDLSSDSQSVSLDIWITEGERIKTRHVDIIGVDEETVRSIEKLMETRSGKIFYDKNLEEDIEEILSFLENNGYPLAEIEIQSLSIDQEEGDTVIDVVLDVDSGSPVTIGRIRIEGNRLTKENVVIRESRLRPGSLYRHREIRASRSNLKRLDIFREVSEPEIVFSENEAQITLKIEEGNANTIDGVIGYNPPKTERDQGYFTGRLAFVFRNLFGTYRFL